MVTQLPKWVETGVFLLAMVAGCINTIGLLGFDHQSVSHVSGTATLFASHLFDSSISHSLHLIGILVSFFLGSALSGLLISNVALELGRHYDTALILEVVLIISAMLLLANHSNLGHYAASAACGLQNAMVTTYSGAIIRTTHLTGIFTDLGIMLGQWLRGKPFDKRKAKIFIFIVGGFISGGVIGALLYNQISFYSLLFPASLCITLALTYRVFRIKNRHIHN